MKCALLLLDVFALYDNSASQHHEHVGLYKEINLPCWNGSGKLFFTLAILPDPTMSPTLFFATVSLLLCYTALKVWKWRQNYLKARSTGFPTFYSPVHVTDFWWLVIQPVAVPLVQRLPSSLTFPWLSMSQVRSLWKRGHTTFASVGSDTIILATPKGNMLWTADPSVISDIVQQHSKAQLPVESVQFFEIYGPAVGSREGDEWKTYRRVATSAFTTDTNDMVWKESLHQATSMIDKWFAAGSNIPVVKDWTSRLGLNVLSGALFNRRLGWDDLSQRSNESRMPFEQALPLTISNLGIIFMTPRSLLPKMPGQYFREASDAYSALKHYMNEMVSSTLSHSDTVAKHKHKSILESIVLAGTEDKISSDAMLGNTFFMLIAGQETSGNTLAFAFLLLAIHQDVQRKLQAELDSHFGGRSPSEWTLDDYTPLQQGYLGAINKEVLRVYFVAQFIARLTNSPTKVTTRHGQSHIIPPDTLCLFDFSACYQNPDLWPGTSDISTSRRKELHNSPALDFNPDRFHNSSASMLESLNTNISTDSAHRSTTSSGKSGDTTDDSSQKPIHFPFGLGPRSCPGRLFALIELTAVLATVFSSYNLELVVSAKTLAECDGNGEKARELTRDRAIVTMYEGVTASLTLEMKEELPIRIVKRRG